MGLSLLIPPALEPITREEAKAHLRLEISDDDAYVDSLIMASRQFAERYQQRALMSQTWKLTLDCFPDVIRVPLPPLQSATIDYIDLDGVLQSLPATEFHVDIESTPGRIAPAFAKHWPATREQHSAVQVSFVAGYSTIPETTKQAMLMLIAGWYENREAVVAGNLTVVPLAVESLLDFECWGNI